MVVGVSSPKLSLFSTDSGIRLILVSESNNAFSISKFPMVQARMEISVSTDISVLGFYKYIGGYFYMNIDISEINKNTLKFMEILSKSVKMTLIIKYIH